MPDKYIDLTIDELREKVRTNVGILINLFKKNNKNYSVEFDFLRNVTEFFGYDENHEMLFHYQTCVHNKGTCLVFYYKDMYYYLSLTEDNIKDLDMERVEQRLKILDKAVDEYWELLY